MILTITSNSSSWYRETMQTIVCDRSCITIDLKQCKPLQKRTRKFTSISKKKRSEKGIPTLGCITKDWRLIRVKLTIFYNMTIFYKWSILIVAFILLRRYIVINICWFSLLVFIYTCDIYQKIPWIIKTIIFHSLKGTYKIWKKKLKTI